jgi:hypothetical protein
MVTQTMRSGCFALALALAAASAVAAPAPLGGNPTETMKTLYAQGQFEQAYNLGRAAE